MQRKKFKVLIFVLTALPTTSLVLQLLVGFFLNTLHPVIMGKRGAGDVEKLKAMQESLRKKMEAERAAATSASSTAAAATAATSTATAEDLMPPPKVPKKSAKDAKVKAKGGKQNASENASPSTTESEMETSESSAAELDVKSKPRKRSRNVEGDVEEEPRPKAKAKAKAKTKAPTPGEPDFEVTWENHGLLMKHYGINEDEATACLLAVIGQDERYVKYWGKFSVEKNEEKKDEKNEEKTETKSPAESRSTSKSKPAKKAQAKKAAPKPKPAPVDPDDDTSLEEEPGDDNADGEGGDEDGETASTTSSQPPPPPPPPAATKAKVALETMIDTMDALPMETPEPVIEAVASKPDDAELARQALSNMVRTAPTPAKAVEKKAIFLKSKTIETTINKREVLGTRGGRNLLNLSITRKFRHKSKSM